MDSFWDEQKNIRKRLNLNTQNIVSDYTRKNLIFTQRLPNITPQSQISPNSQELEQLLEYIEKYDPDKLVESFDKQDRKTQLEVESILDDVPSFHVPATFSVKPLSDSLLNSSSQQKTQQVQTFSTKLIVQNHISVYSPKEEIVSQKVNEKESQKSNYILEQNDIHASQKISLLFLEIGCKSRNNLLPDPAFDRVICVSYSYVIDNIVIDSGLIYLGPHFLFPVKTKFVDDELSLFASLVELILKLNPDMIIGFNVEKESLGYLKERAETLKLPNFFDSISRLKDHFVSSDICRKIGGRILINLWRIVRKLEQLRIYTLTNVSEKILEKPFPEIDSKQLNYWINNSPYNFALYIYDKMNVVKEIVDKMVLVDYFCELSIVFGIDICSTLTRGSQFLIESLLCRVSLNMGYLLLSPTKKDVASQRAPMCVPLVMEPKSGMYTDPVIVIDFQSLYPSAIAAYNLCYSTILGRTEDIQTGGQLGCIPNFQVKRDHLEQLLDSKSVINTPNDVLFIKKNVRQGVLPTLLEQILLLRGYIKETLKSTTNEKLKRILDSKQKALKMFAACVYGYTAAHYTGRMPCIELSDSIVECSRHMIEFVLDYIEKNYINLNVLYGDTDSLFIQLPNLSKEKAFQFGEKLCKEISNFFPEPVKIKLERIYYGCFLVNKKRYCGLMFESMEQEEPTMDVKGLEIKRRDSCLLVSKIMTDVVECLFKTKNINIAKDIFNDYLYKIRNDSTPLSDYIFSKEIRQGTYKVKPPVAYVVEKQEKIGHMMKPLYGERIQYLVVSSLPKAKLIERVVSIQEFKKRKLRIGIRYYIERQIVPALGRVLETINIDINDWVKGIDFELHQLPLYPFQKSKNITTLERYFKQIQCPLCGKTYKSPFSVCSECLSNGGRKECLYELIQRIKYSEKIIKKCTKKCSMCVGHQGFTMSNLKCYSCENYWICKLHTKKKKAYESYQNNIFKYA